MPPRGEFRSRGGRGRGRGGRSDRGSRKRFGPRFDNARISNIEEDNSDASEPEEDEYIEDGGGDASDDEDDSDSDVEEGQKVTTTKPYLALLESLARDEGPQAKRRKLAHAGGSETSIAADVPDDPDEERDLDLVEEAEEDPAEEHEVAEEGEDSDDDSSMSPDPFVGHFVKHDEDEVSKRLAALDAKDFSQQQSELNGFRCFGTVPKSMPNQTPKSFTLGTGPADLHLKPKLAGTASKRPKYNQLEQVLYPPVFAYNDVFFCGRTPRNAETLRRMSCSHAINHIFKTRDRVVKNNAKLSRDGDEADVGRDQGFTRPKVLFILPTRQAAVKLVDMICSVCEPEQQENRKRFDESYIDREEKFSGDRPEDFRELFEGNDDDMFRIGVKFTRKNIKYFSQFYNSDILIASPLGLRMAIGSEEDKKLDFDFLSSIEVAIVDQADALLMQNWEHVEFVFEHMNLQPKEAHGFDIGRVREWYLNGQAKHFRQNIILSAFNTPELSELHRRGQNWEGRVRVQPAYPGTLQELAVKAKQTFSRFEAASIAGEPDARFEYFKKAVVPALARRAKDAAGTLVFIPSYLDFVRVRNFFAASPAVAGLSFGHISEYAEVAEASRARSFFANGRLKVLLYTERAHHFRRYVLKGVRRVVMYGLPDNPLFYKEIAGGYLGKSEQDSSLEPGAGSVRVVFSRYDVLKLERVVGSKRVGKMIRERGDTFDFV